MSELELGSNLDIAECEQLENPCSQSQAYLQQALEAARMVAWEWNVSDNTVIHSSTAVDVLGMSQFLTVSASTALASIHPDDVAQHLATVEAARTNNGSYKSQFRWVRPDTGEIIWLEDRGNVKFDKAGNIVKINGVAIDITERKRTEEALQSASDKIHVILASITDAFVAFDSNWHYVYMNEAAERLLELPKSTLLGRSVWELFPAEVENNTKTYQELHRAIAEQVPVQYEEFSPGLNFWVEVNAYPSGDGLAVYFRNISDRKGAELILQRRAEQIRMAQLLAKAGLWDWDVSTNQVSWSEEYYELFDIDSQTAPSYENWLEIIIEQDRERADREVRFALQSHLPLDVEYRCIHPHHGLRWFAAIGDTIYDTQGKPQRMVGISIDITERKLIEEALRHSEERYRSLIQATTQIIWDTTANGILVTEQRGWSEFTGQTYDEYKGWGWLSAIHPDDQQKTRLAWEFALQNVTIYEIEHRLKRFDGDYRHMSARAVPVLNADGSIREWVGVHTDITERKQILLREQAAREAAERANRIKDEFLAVLSHELRTPMNPILGWTRLLRSGKLNPEKTQQAFETIERNAKLQTQLIDDLLDISKILRGKFVLNPTPQNLRLIVSGALDTVKLAAQAKGIVITTILEDTGQVCGDAARLQQVFWNLLSNSIKFTPQGGNVEVRLERDGTQAKIQVRDTGKGIGADFLPFVFDTFRQADSAITRSFGGLGLGLAIVKQLVELHGGSVEAYSAGEQLGATFTVKLPLIPVIQEMSQIPPTTSDLSNLQGRRILVVDDDKDSQELLAFMLEQEGAEIQTVSSASEALEMLIQWRPDILLSDIGMPQIDGYTLIRQVRNLPKEQGGQVPAIALTAYAAEADRETALSSGFQQHIAKPIDPIECIDAIVQLLGQR